MSDPLYVLYRQNEAYQPRHDGTLWLLEDADGWGLACDEWVYQIRQAFDGRPTAEVIAGVTDQLGCSAALVESTAKVLARAGMLWPEEPLPPLRPRSASDVSDLSPFPLVSVIILASRDARHHLETCLPSVLAQSYPNVEVILVDNQTTDDSAAYTRAHFPQVRVLSTPRPLGFGGANNYAMKQATGELLLMVNEDTEMEPACVAECVRVMCQSDRIAVVAPKMKLFYMRDFFNSMGNSLHPNGQSHDNFIGFLDVGQFDDTTQVFAACFGAGMVRRSVLEEIGYMDEEYFVYYDDTDWSLRARIYGYDVVAAPRAVVYHKFNATVNTMASTFKLGLIIRNRLRFAWKNLDFRRASRFLWMYLQEDIGNLLCALSRREYAVARTYIKSRWQWAVSWPEATLRRWQTRRMCRPPFSDDAAFALVDQVPSPCMYGRYPVVLASFVRAHYMQLDRFRPDSPPAPEDQVAPIGPMQAPRPPKLVKAWQALRQGGVPALVNETRNYLRWRLGSL
ncbi:MAG: glycosyltransferase family 2 protein [Anaerolineae bacterium]|nr:glycosyltransferase family 2 protein [Anaerolineae bacterium]